MDRVNIVSEFLGLQVEKFSWTSIFICFSLQRHLMVQLRLENRLCWMRRCWNQPKLMSWLIYWHSIGSTRFMFANYSAIWSQLNRWLRHMLGISRKNSQSCTRLFNFVQLCQASKFFQNSENSLMSGWLCMISRMCSRSKTKLTTTCSTCQSSAGSSSTTKLCTSCWAKIMSKLTTLDCRSVVIWSSMQQVRSCQWVARRASRLLRHRKAILR